MSGTFDDELADLMERARLEGMPFVELEAAVAQLHRRHGREVPPPITGSIAGIESEDGFGGA